MQGEAIRVDGRLDGDLVAAANRVVVGGRVDGDLFAAGATVDLRGSIGDSTRAVARTVTVDTTIDGDLLGLADALIVTEDARITGGVMAAAGRVEIAGTVEGGARVAAGEMLVSGTVHGDANIVADRLELAPGARVIGDLQYRARTPLSPEEAARVEGAVRYDQPVQEPEEGGAAWGVVLWLWQTLAALLTGIVVVALFRRGVQGLAASMAAETTLSALLGFSAFLLVPVAAAIAMVTLVGLPIGLAAALLFGLALYAAKLPLAVCIGDRLLGLTGRPSASPYAAMALGILLLYLLFAIPLRRVAVLARRHVAGPGRHDCLRPAVPGAPRPRRVGRSWIGIGFAGRVSGSVAPATREARRRTGCCRCSGAAPASGPGSGPSPR